MDMQIPNTVVISYLSSKTMTLINISLHFIKELEIIEGVQAMLQRTLGQATEQIR